jgi:hypothetical protein
MPEELRQAMEKVAKILENLAQIQAQHNKMILDLYERVAKLEEEV